EIRPMTALIEFGVPEEDRVQPQEGEAVVAHQPHRLAAVALSPSRLIADGDAKFGHAFALIHEVEADVADRLPALADNDREGLHIAILDHAVVPFLLVLEHERHAGCAEIRGQLKVAEPARVEW